MAKNASVLFLIVLWTTPAWALPAPKTEAEMLTLSDLVVDASCVAIACEGKPKDDGTKLITAYRSTLYPSKSYKGGTPKSFVIIGESWKYHGPPPVGGWHQEPVAKGWVGKLYLKRLSTGTYTKVWWNASATDTAKSKPLPLPSCGAATDGGPKPDGNIICDLPMMKDKAPTPDKAAMPDKQQMVPDHPWPSEGSTPVKKDGGTSSGGDSDGCSLAGGDTSSLSWLLALGALLLIRRRRAR